MREIQRIEEMTEDQLDAELKSYGINRAELHLNMLKRILKAKSEGHDTPMLNEALRQFVEAFISDHEATMRELLAIANTPEWFDTPCARAIREALKAGE